MSRLESDYYAHMGFEVDHMRRVRSFYLPFFAGGPVLELACGRGEFLALLAESGISCEGVDRDEGMVATARSAGQEVHQGDALEFLANASGNTYEGVFAAHVLEHLVPEQAVELLLGAFRVLRPGGALVLVVPNPACYAVLTHDFWSDPTHVRFYDVPLLRFLCEHVGFEILESGGNPEDHPGPPPGFEADLSLPAPVLPEVIDAAIDSLSADARHFGVILRELNRSVGDLRASLQHLESAHRTLVRGMYEPNEIFVRAVKR